MVISNIPVDQIWIVAVGFVIAFILAFGIGANDVANSFGTSVGSKVLTLRKACILASIFEILGSVLIGAKVSDTVRHGVLEPEALEAANITNYAEVMMLGHLSSLTGTCVWLLIATFFKLPVSGSHSIVGAMVGVAAIIQGINGIDWKKIGYIVLSWFLSPILSGLVSVTTFFLFDEFILKKDDPLEPGLRFLPFIYAITIFINIFSIFLSGPTLLRFDAVPLYGNFIISIGSSIITIIIVMFVVVPYLRKTITNKQQNGDVKVNKAEEISPNIVLDADHKTKDQTAPNDVNNSKVDLVKIEEVGLETTMKENLKNMIEDKPEQIALFKWVQILTSIFGSFAHGGNDVSNAIGPLVGLWIIAVTQDIHSQMPIPIWILFYGGVGIIIGLWVWGRRVMKTIGDELTIITPSSGVSIELGSAITVLIASNVGLPISTTHCKVGSIISVGRYRSNENVDWKVFRNIVFAWIVTVPVTAGISAVTMYLLKMLI